MLRLTLVLKFLLVASICQTAHARGPFGRWFFGNGAATSAPIRTHGAAPYREPTRSHQETTIFGMGVGVGSYPPYNYPRPGQFDPYRFDSYLYDPYRSGSFEAPDLLNDPYFRERHRYDSAFPGRRHRR